MDYFFFLSNLVFGVTYTCSSVRPTNTINCSNIYLLIEMIIIENWFFFYISTLLIITSKILLYILLTFFVSYNRDNDSVHLVVLLSSTLFYYCFCRTQFVFSPFRNKQKLSYTCTGT